MYVQYRTGEYLIGILTGYLIFNFQEKKIKLSRKAYWFVVIPAWVLSVLCFSWLFLYKPDAPRKTFSDNIFASVWQEAFACIICWKIFSCHILESGGCFDVFRWFTGLKFWQPISKMSMSIYLVHYIYIILTNGNHKQKVLHFMWWQIHVYIGDLAITVILSTIFYLLVEAPFMQLTSAWSFLEGRKFSQRRVSSKSSIL